MLFAYLANGAGAACLILSQHPNHRAASLIHKKNWQFPEVLMQKGDELILPIPTSCRLVASGME